ncbi:MerR family transcriptional regulator [Roseicyclus sp. F158]|uniref:MerR family transcriptional regulator n=1 Tax=Tropicimonas omnivorans TaxID=3075590 RepID=A0ABU3DJ73_9RHOB|nr:MerR family transcriptional regulator [Roseicyclus sp. F158]MDT0683768.1 MerR family transcriptional regulator [Roseicyclus sp. F158]
MSAKSPDAFRNISEVAEWLGVASHVMRYWESQFTQIRPTKRAGGRRYYRRSDMELLDGIRQLLYEEGMTVKAVQRLLKEEGVKAVSARSRPIEAPSLGKSGRTSRKSTAAQVPANDPGPAASPEAATIRTSEDAEARPIPVMDQALPDPDAEPDDIAEPQELADLEALDAPPPEPARDEADGDEGTKATTETDIPSAWVAERAEPPSSDAPGDGPLFASRGETPPDDAGADHGPVVAPLPARDMTLAEGLRHLEPGRIPPDRLLPICDRLLGLRERMG